MKFFRTILSTFAVSCLVVVSDAKKDDDAAAQAVRDMQSGMAGLKEAASNPAMLAQLMRDLAVSAEWIVSCLYMMKECSGPFCSVVPIVLL